MSEMSSEGSAEGLVPSALSSEKSPMLYVSFGENEQMCLLYDRTHTIHLAVSIANQMNKIKLERKKLEEELDEYRQRKSGTTNKKERSKLEDLMRITLLALTKQRPDLIMPDTNLLQMDICSQSKGILTWSRPLEEDVIEEAQNCETPLAVTERIGFPLRKRRAMAVTINSRKPTCKAPEEEAKNNASAEKKSEDAPAYYHLVAVRIYDQFIDEADIEFKVDISAVDRTVKHLSTIKRIQSSSNEYRCSAMLQVALDRFFFGNGDAFELGACLGQYPVYENRRSDGSVYTYDADYTTERDILHYDYKKYDLQTAIRESLFYVISAHLCFKGYSWSFGLPCTSEHMVFMMYLSANSKIYTIELARVEIEDNVALRQFLRILYDAVHRRIRYWAPPQTNPFACMPSETLELRDNFMSHDSKRLFLYDETAYKFYCKHDPNKKKPNMGLMEQLGYYKNLKLQDVGKNHTLLSYTVFSGVREWPLFWNQIDSAFDSIATLHKQKFVHGDIRVGNVLFSCTSREAYLIDLDFTDKYGVPYPNDYSGRSLVKERHYTAAKGLPRKYIHDSFSLMEIAARYLPPSRKLSKLVSDASSYCICNNCRDQ